MDKRKKQILQVVVETQEFIKQAESCMDEDNRKDFIHFIAGNPLAGDLIIGTGGARKIRFSADKHSGKSGGVRVIYFYHNQQIPIFLLTVYGKNKKANLSHKECKMLKTILKSIVETYEENTDE